MRVDLLGGPLAGTRVAWLADGPEATFPTGELVAIFGVHLDEPIVLDAATYRLLPRLLNLGTSGARARHVA